MCVPITRGNVASGVAIAVVGVVVVAVGVVVAVAVCVAASVSRQTKKLPPSVVLLQIWIMMPSTF